MIKQKAGGSPAFLRASCGGEQSVAAKGKEPYAGGHMALLWNRQPSGWNDNAAMWRPSQHLWRGSVNQFTGAQKNRIFGKLDLFFPLSASQFANSASVTREKMTRVNIFLASLRAHSVQMLLTLTTKMAT